MFRGRHTHAIDNKGRVSIPSKFREILSVQHGNQIVMTTALDPCIVAYPPRAWQELEEKVLKYPSMHPHVSYFKRFFISGAVDCALDAQGRILIPPSLREHAALSKEVLFVGLLDKIEIWDVERWNQSIPREGMEEIRKAMADLGL
jgi:MraZ protein